MKKINKNYIQMVCYIFYLHFEIQPRYDLLYKLK